MLQDIAAIISHPCTTSAHAYSIIRLSSQLAELSPTDDNNDRINFLPLKKRITYASACFYLSHRYTVSCGMADTLAIL